MKEVQELCKSYSLLEELYLVHSPIFHPDQSMEFTSTGFARLVIRGTGLIC